MRRTTATAAAALLALAVPAAPAAAQGTLYEPFPEPAQREQAAEFVEGLGERGSRAGAPGADLEGGEFLAPGAATVREPEGPGEATGRAAPPGGGPSPAALLVVALLPVLLLSAGWRRRRRDPAAGPA